MTRDAAADLAPLPDLVRRLARASVLVVGDAMFDRSVFGAVSRVSPEAPVPVLAVQRELAMPGGAGNVVRNLGALGAAVAFVSVVGDDQAGSDLTGLIGGQPGVEPWLLVQSGRTTTQKTRMIAQGQQLLRVDREEVSPIHAKLAERLVRIARDAMAATSVTVLSDYRKGVLAGDVPAQLIAAARQTGRPVVADVRGGDFARYGGADVLVLMQRDLVGLALPQAGPPHAADAAIADAAAGLRAAHAFGAVLVWRDAGGMTLVDANGARHWHGVMDELFDAAGAGDTATATLAAALASGASLTNAAHLADIAAGLAMGRIGTAVVRVVDLLAALSPDRAGARKIMTLAAASEQAERWRRRGARIGVAAGRFAELGAGKLHLLEVARLTCDRLIVALTHDANLRPPAERAAELAALAVVDLVVPVGAGEDATAILQALRPEILATGADNVARDAATAELLRGWGGQIVQADRVAEGSE